MTLQSDSNTSAAALAIYVDHAPLENATAAPLPGPRKLNLPLIDWNLTQPNGTDKSLQDLLQHLGVLLHGEIHVGWAKASGGVGPIYSSHIKANREALPLGLTSSILEASFATGKFLSASEGEVTSGVLENYRVSERQLCVLGFAIPDLHSSAEPCAGMVIGFREDLPNDVELSKHLTQMRLELAAWLQVWQACRAAQSIDGWTRWLRSWQGRRGLFIAIGAVLCCSAMFIQVPYWPQRECVVEPSARRFVSSPIDGRVLESLVRPGDVVASGQVIGRLDDEQLHWELSAARAEMQQAGKQQDSALAHQEGGKMRLAQLEQQKISLKIQALQAQLERLELRSPVAGVVLQGEWYRSQGAPVARGDTLFEIAPLEKMTVFVHLTTEDLSEVCVDDEATIRIDSAFGEAWRGTLSRIDPRAAVIDNEIRFVGDIEVDNRESRLRPGMKGAVRIATGSKSLGWLVFHRPYTWLMKQLVW